MHFIRTRQSKVTKNCKKYFVVLIVGLILAYISYNQHNRVQNNDLELPVIYMQPADSDKLRSLGNEVQARLYRLQHPTDCTAARKLVCTIDNDTPCGFGCLLHHTAYCFFLAYGTNRTLILNVTWKYTKNGWSDMFKPVTNCSAPRNNGNEPPKLWSGRKEEENQRTLYVKTVDRLDERRLHIPAYLPNDIVDHLLATHSYPPAWWIGQFESYLSRPNGALEQVLTSAHKLMTPPFAGIHVRRTDKLKKEARKFELAQYMIYVDNYFELLERIQPNRTMIRPVYLATDEPNVVKEAVKKYANYRFVFYSDVVESARRLDGSTSRFSKVSLQGIIRDTHLLSLSDYLVCTFTSNVCRLAYELMQVRHNGRDMSDRVKSLDISFYMHGQTDAALLWNSLYPR